MEKFVKVRNFLCRNLKNNVWTLAGSWITKDDKLNKLKHAKSLKDMASCAHAHHPPNFKDGCNVETYDFGSGTYHCRYHGYHEGHDHYNEHVHGHDHYSGHKHKHKHGKGNKHKHNHRRDDDGEAAADDYGDYSYDDFAYDSGTVRSLDEAEDRWGKAHGYEKVKYLKNTQRKYHFKNTCHVFIIVNV